MALKKQKPKTKNSKKGSKIVKSKTRKTTPKRKTSAPHRKTPKKKIIPIGGMSFGSGVLLRSLNYTAIAVRDDVGRIELSSFKTKDIRDRYPFLTLPFFRGAFYLLESSFLLVKASLYKRSFEKRMLREKTKSQRVFGWLNRYLIYTMSILVFIAFFSYANTRLGSLVASDFKSFLYTFLFTLLLMIFFILVFVLVVMNRHDKLEILEYHATEHMIVNAYEQKKKISEKDVLNMTATHERCGLFILAWTVIIFSFFLSFLRVGVYDWFFGLAVSIGLVIISFSLAYELVRFITLGRSSLLRALFLGPLYFIQALSLYPPDEKHVKTGMVAFREIIKLESSR